MKTHTRFVSLILACGLGVLAQAEPAFNPELQARMIIAEIDQDVLTEQYRGIQMETFKSRMDLQMTRAKVRHAPDPDKAAVERAIAVQEERLEFLEEMRNRTRERLFRLIVERCELEAELDAAMQPVREFEGRWSGRDEEDAPVRLTVEGDHARFEIETDSGEAWLEAELGAEPRDDGLWNIQLHILKGSEGELARYEQRTSLGVARLEGDRLVMALTEPGTGVRPDSVETDDGDVKVVRLERH